MDCKQVFEDTINEILGTEHTLDNVKWEEVKTLVGSWVDLMEELGASPEDPVYTDALKSANIPFMPSEKRVQHVNTMLDVFLENYIGKLVHDDAITMLRKYRNEQAYINLTQLVQQAGDIVKKNKPNLKEPGRALAKGLRDLLASKSDNTKNWLSLEERINANFMSYFNQTFIKRIQNDLPDANIHKLLHDETFVNDLVTEVMRSDADIQAKKYTTTNNEARIFAEALIDANGQLITQLQRKGAKVNMKANEVIPNFNWAKIKAWGKTKGNGRTAFIETISKHLHDEHGSLTDKQQYAQDLYDSMDKYGGFIEWTEIHGAVDEPVPSMKHHSQRPMLKLKDGKSWLEVNNLFGERADFMGTMVGQFKFMSKTLALTEMLGPEWRQTWDRISKYVATVETGGQTAGGAGRVLGGREYKAAQNTFDRLTASSKTPADFTLDSALKAGRSAMVASKLGSATLAALMDLPIAITVISRLYGMSTLKNLSQIPAGFTSKEARLYAQQLGTAVEGMMGSMQDRFMLYDDWNTMNKVQRGAGKAAQFIMKVSGLEAWTDGMKTGVTSVIRSAMGDLITTGQKWAELDGRFKGTLERFAITEKEWNSFNSKHLDKNGKFDVFAIADKDLRTKITAWYKDAVDTGVISPSLRDAEYGALFMLPGSTAEEVAKTITQFKTFPITFTRKLLGRTLATQSGAELAITLGTYMAMALPMGIVVVQMKQIAAGKQPYAMDSAKLYEQALFYASPLGIYQDMLSQAGLSDLALMAFGKKPKNIDAAALIAGPLFTELGKGVGNVTKLGGAALANAGFVDNYNFDPEQTLEKQLSKTTQWALSQVPGQNLWYTKSIYKLAFTDALHEMMDPSGYRRKQYNQQRNAKEHINGELYNPYGDWLQGK